MNNKWNRISMLSNSFCLKNLQGGFFCLWHSSMVPEVGNLLAPPYSVTRKDGIFWFFKPDVRTLVGTSK